VTTVYHTPHTFGEELSSANVNAPLAELDTAIGYSRFATYDAREYGVVADDSTDNVSALQAVFNAAHTTPGRILLPAGIIRFSATIEMPYPTTIVGHGARITTLKYTGAGTAMKFKNYATAVQRTGVTLQDFGLIATTYGSGTLGMDLKGISVGRVERIFVDNFGTGIKVDGSYGGSIGAWRNVLYACEVEDCGTGIQFWGINAAGQGNENYVENCFTRQCTTYGVLIEQSDHVTLRDSEFTSNTTGAYSVYATSGSECVRIINNRFETTQHGVYANASRPVIQHNIFSGTMDDGIELGASALGAIISPNWWGADVTTKVIDGSAQSDAVRTIAGPTMFPLIFYSSSVAAGLTNSILLPLGSATATMDKLPMYHPYQIRGLTWRTEESITAGTLTMKATVGGTPSSVIVVDATTGAIGGDWFGANLETNAGTSSVGCKITTTSSPAYAPAAKGLYVIVWVESCDYNYI